MIAFFRKKALLLKEELASYTPKQRAFIFFAMLCGFCITCEYAIIRPVINSLFIHTFSAKLFPIAWIATVPLNFWLVSVYNRLIHKWGSKKLFLTLVFTVMGTNTFFALTAKLFPPLSFIFYVWKELYVLLMFQLLWSLIHANIELKKAKYLYGIIFGIGGLGAMVGSSLPSFLAIPFGSEQLLFFTLPVYGALTYTYLKLTTFSETNGPEVSPSSKGGFLHGLQLIARSRFLIFILLIVGLMQMSSAIIEFQFNDFLEQAIPGKDLRTAYSARILGIVHTLTVIIQFIGTYFIIQWLGMKRSHYLVPSVIGISLCLLLAIPLLPLAAFAFIAIKSLDFSFFGVIKEMLYIPLSHDEKFRAKSIIDVFAYRSSKAFASLLILLIEFSFFETTRTLSYLGLFLAGLWILAVGYGLKEFGRIQGS